MNGTLQAGAGQNARRATSISVIGCEPGFWSLGEGGPKNELVNDEMAITESVARELEAKVGDNVLLRIPAVNALPADSPLGAKQAEKTTRSRRLRIAAILPPVGLARFGLMPSQQLPRNVFLPLTTLQALLEQPRKINAILVAGVREQASGVPFQGILKRAFQPTLEDLGLRAEEIHSPSTPELISSDQLVLPDSVVRAAEKAFSKEKLQPVVTYLANTIVAGEPGSERKIPYSTIAGVDSMPGIGPLLDDEGKPISSRMMRLS